MKRGRLLFFVVAVAALAVFPLLFRRYDDSAVRWEFSLDREEIRQRVEQLAQEQGLDTRSWTWSLHSQATGRVATGRRYLPQSQVLRACSANEVKAIARNPQRTQYVEAVFGADGQLNAFRAYPPVPAVTTEDVWFRRLAGSSADRFRPITIDAKGRDGVLSSWEWADADAPGVIGRIDVLINSGHLVQASRTTEVSDGALGPERDKTRSILAVFVSLGLLTVFVALSVSGWVFFQRMSKRRDHVGFPMWPLAVVASLLILGYLAGTRLGPMLTNPQTYLSGDVALQIGSFGGEVLLLIAAYQLLAAGYVLLEPSERLQWAGLGLVSTKRLLNRRVALEATAAGFGSVLALVLLYGISAANPFGERPLRLFGPEFLFAPWPALLAAREFFSFDLLGAFAFVIPFAGAFVRWRWARLPLVALTALPIGMWLRRPFEREISLDVSAILVLLLVAWWLYRSFGLLSVLLMSPWIALVHQAAAAWSQPSTGLSAQGLTAAGILAGLATAGGLVARFGPAVDEEAVAAGMAARAQDTERSERERLETEFSVAQRAQQKMLPTAAPAIKGVSVSAICRPAREVGGDLYDFVRLMDGRVAFCVADVSGKGVSASLFMTLTKGILTASARTMSDPRELMCQLNRHLHSTCKNKMFVTMAMGAYDEETRQLEYLRAGHNPILWKKAAGGLEFVQPKGMGLGLAKPLWFDRALEVQSLTLAPGDIVVFYSDGLTEAMNRNSEQFTEERLEKVLTEVNGDDPAGIQRKILEAVDRFTAGADPHDDLTLLVLRIN